MRKNRNVPFFFSTLIAVIMGPLGGCKPNSPETDQADTTAAAESAPRYQGQNGTCWIYAFGNMLNLTLSRQMYRREHGHTDRRGFWEKHEGRVASVGQHLARIRANSGELVSHVSLAQDAAVKQMPKISINALIYTHYMHSLSQWLGTPWPFFAKFEADGGLPSDFNELYKKGLLTSQQFPDGDFSPSELDERTRTSLCNGKAKKDCNPLSIVDIVNRSGLYKKEPALQPALIQQLLENSYKVPDVFRVKLNNGKIRYPILEDENNYRSPAGISVARKDLAEILWQLPQDINMWSWGNQPLSALFSWRVQMWRRWSDLAKLNYPSAQEMAEISAILTILNQPAAFIIYDWSKKALGSNIISPSQGWMDALGPHAMMLNDYKVSRGELVLQIRNSWGSQSSDLKFGEFEKSKWELSLPSYLWEEVMLPYRDTSTGKCDGMSGNTAAFAAAFKYLKEKGYQSSGKSINDKMLAYAEKCLP